MANSKRPSRRSPEIEFDGVDYGYATSHPKRTTSGKICVGISSRGVVDAVLNKGIVIDLWASVSVIGLRVMDIEAEVTVASLEAYLRYADAIEKKCPAAAVIA